MIKSEECIMNNEGELPIDFLPFAHCPLPFALSVLH